MKISCNKIKVLIDLQCMSFGWKNDSSSATSATKAEDTT